MARGNPIKFLRTTRANLDVQKAASGLIAGEPYLITDELLLAVATATNGYAVIGRHKLTGGTLSNSTTRAISLAAYIAAGYTKFDLYLNAIAPAADGAYLVMDVSTNDGSSYLNSGYYSPGLTSIQGTTPAGYDSGSRANFVLTDSTGNAIGEAADAHVSFRITSSRFIISSHGYHLTTAGALRRFVMDGGHPTAGVNNVRFYQTTGNMASGEWELYGER